jgi:hypothetical protein
MDDLHVVDVKIARDMRTAREMRLWVVYLSDGKVMHASAFDHSDELSAYAYVTNKLKEQANGTNSRA